LNLKIKLYTSRHNSGKLQAFFKYVSTHPHYVENPGRFPECELLLCAFQRIVLAAEAKKYAGLAGAHQLIASFPFSAFIPSRAEAASAAFDYSDGQLESILRQSSGAACLSRLTCPST
jgi:hypothetical protein